MNSRSNQRNLTFGENSRNLRIFGRFFPLTFRIITRFSSNSYFHMRAPYFNDYQNQNKWSLPQFGDFLSTKNVRLSVCPSVCLSVCLSVLRLWTAILFESLLGHPIGSKLPGWIFQSTPMYTIIKDLRSSQLLRVFYFWFYMVRFADNLEK